MDVITRASCHKTGLYVGLLIFFVTGKFEFPI